ncbi:coiled-coil domain-containing protein 73 isoform X2 [Pundamilia nyererei]|uniref:Coiled-coil domain-containing protein 73 isoform X2 n=1 Tax=Pundamilia nyererei TaxID=303518 RepID=A0A9Y6JFW1_9CICH|nr:PREDICTED: coiled-coil domain-containing protein 73 isoform X2 [Pundamilia nyererei]
MDVSTESETLPTHTTFGEDVLEHELNLSSSHCQTESGGNILLQLLEFKTNLLEAVQELHIRRDAETRFEDQISKLVLEKQEMEWEKESLQHRIESVTKQHTESLTNLKKQAKLRNTEEEKGKYQVIAELKDKEINNLKEELKSLQLLKYNLEKKSSELEQKLVLQSRTKDGHLSQLGEVEKRFSALSRQCAMVKQAHDNLEQNVDEAMRINKKLTSANEKQAATIVSLKKELDEVSNELSKAKMTSVRPAKPYSPTGREQHIQQLHQKLKLETEMNKKLREENATELAEKQEVIRSLQHTQQLLLSQTQTVRRVELELQTQRQTCEALKQEHEVMGEQSKAMEDKVAQLMESYAASKTSWDKEKTKFLDRLKTQQEALQALKEAYDDLHQKHAELSLQAKSHEQHTHEMEVRDSSQTLSVSTHPTSVEEVRGEESVSERISRSKLPGFGSLQHSVSSQAKIPDRLEDTATGTKILATAETEGQKVPKQQSQTIKEPLSHLKMPSCPLTMNFSSCTFSGTGATEAITLNKGVNNSKSEHNPDVLSDLTNTALSVSDDDSHFIRGCCASSITASNSDYSSLGESADLPTNMKNKGDDTGMNEKEHEEKDSGKQGNSHREEEEKNTGQLRNREDDQGEDVKEGGRAGEKRGTAMAQTTDRRNRREDSEGSAKDAGTETKDRADGAKEREKTAVQTPQTQIRAQTITDMTAEKSHTLQVIDFMGAEPPVDVCKPSDFTQSLCQKVSEKDAECKHLKIHGETGRDGEHQSVSSEQQEVSNLCQNEVQSSDGDTGSLSQPPTKKAGELSAGLSEHLKQSSTSQTGDAASAGHSNGFHSAENLGSCQTHTETRTPSDVISDMMQTDEIFDVPVSEKLAEPEQLLESLEQKDGQLKSVVTVEGKGDVENRRKDESSVDTNVYQTPMEESHLKDGNVNITMGAITLDSEVKSEHIKDTEDTKKTKSETDPKLPLVTSLGHKQPELGEKLLSDCGESSLPSKKTYRPLFEWAAAERRKSNSRTKSDVTIAHQPIQGSSLSEQNTTAGFPGHPASTIIPKPLKSKHDNVPLVIMRASDLLNASSVCGTAPSLRRKQQGLWEAVQETCRERTAADTDGRAPPPSCSFPASSTGSKLSWQTTAECSRAPTLAAGPSSESNWELSCSQERDDQQDSFRAQISKIEQFLETERLRLSKRPQTEPNL